MTQTPRPPIKWVVAFPEKDTPWKHSLQNVCYGDTRLGLLLYHFIYLASLEVEKLQLDAATIDEVTITCTHDKLMAGTKELGSYRTLCNWLYVLNASGYVCSERYSKTYTINVTKIREALIAPPQREDRPKLPAPQKKRSESYKIARLQDLPQSELDERVRALEEKVAMYASLQEKYANLQLNYASLQENVAMLQEKVYDLATLQHGLSTSNEAPPEALSEAPSNYVPLRPLSSITSTANTDAAQTQLSTNHPQERRRRKGNKPSLTDTTPIPSPEKPKEVETWIPLTCMRLADYYRGHTLRESERKDSPYQKAVNAAILLVNQQHRTYQQVDAVLRYMKCLDKREDGTGLYDAWWEGKNVDLWHVAEHCEVKLREIERKKKESPQSKAKDDGVHLIGGKPSDELTEEEIDALPTPFLRKAARAARSVPLNFVAALM